MVASLNQVVDLPEQSAPLPGGLLRIALPAPEGWERGIVFPAYGCAAPVAMDGCVTSDDTSESRPSSAAYPPFAIQQRTACSTLGGMDLSQQASDRLAATTEFALGRQLATNALNLEGEYLDDAENLGTAGDAVAGVGFLEEEAALRGFGSRHFLHASPRTAAMLVREKMIDSNGRSPMGARWIISPGYAGTAPGRVWATGTVWVGTDAPFTRVGFDHRMNDAVAAAERSGLVAFDPCINISIDIPVGDAPTTAA